MAIKRPTTTPTPDEIYDYWLSRLSNAELRVLLYVVRHTFGYGKGTVGDAISLRQFHKGVTRKRDGKIIDEGCGLKCRTHIIAALDGLEQKGLIRRERRTMENGGDAATIYVLDVADENQEAGIDLDTGVYRNGYTGGVEADTGGCIPQPTRGGVEADTGGCIPQPTHNKQGNNKQRATNNEQQTTTQHPPVQGHQEPETQAGPQTRPERRVVSSTQLSLPLGNSTSLEGTESDAQWAAKEWLRRVLRYPEVDPTTLKQWARWSKKKVEAAGRETFAAFVAANERDTDWLLTRRDDGMLWREVVGCEWYAKRWTVFVNAYRHPVAELPVKLPQRQARDAGRVDNSSTGTAVIPWCLKCHSKRDELHRTDCKIRLAGHGDVVTANHCNPQWNVDNGFGRQKNTAG